jgi:short subunit dehydrogenase-like uncharacterized protein
MTLEIRAAARRAAASGSLGVRAAAASQGGPYQRELRASGLPAGGVLTPASGLGHVLVGRLKRSGYSVIVRGKHGLKYDE